nr:PaaI family thioesterase [Desulfobotulus pelophilus]
MRFFSNGERVKSRLVIPDHLRGWHTLVHGGVLATILDEAMSWAAIHLTGHFILTQEMTVRFKKPVHIGEEIRVQSFVNERVSPKKAGLKAEICNMSGDVCAESSGLFALFTTEDFIRKDLVPAHMLEAMNESMWRSA